MELSTEDSYMINKLIRRLSKVKASATELVSLYIPSGFDISTVKNQLTQELSLSANIKSKQTRKAVLSSIEKTLRELQKYQKTPENGLIIFCGDVDQQVGKSNTEIFVLDNLPAPVSVRMYRTEPVFILDPLKDMIESKNVYALISIDKNDAAIAIMKGTSVRVVAKLGSLIPGKFRAGGQSAARFSRVRDNLTKAWYEEVSLKANEVLMPIKDLKGIVVGGPSQTKDSFLREEKLSNELKKKVLAVLDTGYAGEDGIKELVNKSEEVFQQEEIFIEKRLLKEFFTRLGRGEKVTYGLETIIEAIKIGAVDKVLLSESLPDETIDKIMSLAKNYKTSVVMISTNTEEGEQLKLMGGAGAFLRYSIGEA
ncbi:MAG: peptide chain release factor 1 [Nanoarchaeota archaeon]|nr:peptide chain release factor 1 [Nanoarchaeota archaeon]